MAAAANQQQKFLLTGVAIDNLLKCITSGSKCPDSAYFKEGNERLQLEFKKQGVLSVLDDAEEENTPNVQRFACSAPGCGVMLNSIADFEMHYNSAHRYVCCQCKRVQATAHLLDLHVQEQHDVFFQTMVERGHAMYECFLQECKQKMHTPAERKQHCIDKHNFPGNFRYEQNDKKDTKKQPTGAANKKVKDFTFGHCRERTFNTHSEKKHTNALENVDTLKAALQDMECEQADDK